MADLSDRNPFAGDIQKPDFNAEVDPNGALSPGLRLVLLFNSLTAFGDMVRPDRRLAANGTINTDEAFYGFHAWSAQTGTTGVGFSPTIGLQPAEAAAADFTLSALVLFNGTDVAAGSFNAIGAALASDGTGRIPLLSRTATQNFQVSPSANQGTFFTASGGGMYRPGQLTDWHWLTVTSNSATNTTTLYIDGGETFVGSAPTTLANFSLATLLGAGVTGQPGTLWPWPTAAIIAWNRAFSAREAAAQAISPWQSILRPTYAVRVEAMPGGAQPPIPPVPPGGNEPTLAGKGAVFATASVLPPVTSSSILGTAFVQASPVQRTRATIAIGGTGAVAATALSTAPSVAISGVGAVSANALRTLSAVATIGGVGGVAANERARWTALGAIFGAGNIAADATFLEGQRNAHTTIGAVASISAPVARVFKAATCTIGGVGAAQLGAQAAIGKPAGRFLTTGTGAVMASAGVLLAPRVQPVMAPNALPGFFTVEIETYVPGSAATVSTEGHGTRAHGTLSQQTQGSPELTTIIRASDMGYRSAPTDAGGVVAFPPLLDQAFQINSQINLEPDRSAAGASWGSLLLMNLPSYWLDRIAGRQNCDGRRLAVMRGVKGWDPARQYMTDPPYSSLTPAFIGLGTAWTLDAAELQIPLRDTTYYLETAMPIALYGGLGKLDGTGTLQNKALPYCRGGTATAPINNVTPVVVDPVALIYQYNNAPGTVVTLYEAGYAGVGGISYSGDVPNLYDGATAPGTYRTNNARGLFQLGSLPTGPITVDVTGAFQNAGAQSHPYQIARYIMTEDIGIPAGLVDVNSFNAAAAANPRVASYVAGIYFDGGSTISGIAAVSAVLSGLGASLVPFRDGTLRLFVLRDVSIADTIQERMDQYSIVSLQPAQLPPSLYPPRYRFKIGYNHNYTVQASGLNPSTPLARQQYLATSDSFAGWSSDAVLRAYRRPNDPGEILTALLRQVDAQDVANEHGQLWGNRRRLFNMTVPIQRFTRNIGDPVSVSYPLEDLRSGQPARVVGYTVRSVDSSATYTVLV